MESIDSLKKLIHDLLIENDGDLRLSEHRQIILDAKQLGLEERELNKLVQEIDTSINWDFLRKQKEEALIKEEKLKKALAEQKRNEQNATETLQFIIDQCAKDKKFDAGEVKIFFETSDELNQDEVKSAKLLKQYLDTHNYFPLTTPKGVSLRRSLESTDWYKDKLPQSAAPVVPVPPVAKITPPPPPVEQVSKAKIFTAAGLAFLVVSAAFYLFWLKPYIRDKNAEREYAFVDNLSLRSSPVGGVDHNFLQKLEYGTELLIYSKKGDWAEVKANGQQGFVSAQYLLSKNDFHLLNGIFGDAESREVIATSRCRMALLNYFKENNLIGNTDPQILKEIDPNGATKEVWQVFSKKKTSPSNSSFFQRVVDKKSKFTDFACIIKHIASGKRRLLLFSFSEGGDPSLVYAEDAPAEGYIKGVHKSSDELNQTFYVTYDQ